MAKSKKDLNKAKLNLTVREEQRNSRSGSHGAACHAQEE
jgi:hypothetical protein